MFTVYGILLLISDRTVYIPDEDIFIPKFYYIRDIYFSLLPIYAYYVFSKEKLLRIENLFKYFLFFMFVVTIQYANNYLKVTSDLDSEYMTNNVSFRFVSLFPMLFFIGQKKWMQFFFLAYIMVLVILGLKRGAILVGGVCCLQYFYFLQKNSTLKQKIVSCIFVFFFLFILGYFISNQLEVNEGFQNRLESTRQGDTSGRDIIFKTLVQSFQYDPSTLHAIFGKGASMTPSIAGNYAHNDWLEILINNGILGVFIYLIYWISFSWISFTAVNDTIRKSLLMYLVIYLLLSFFSMSYAAMTIFSTLGLGFCLANYKNNEL